MYLFCSKKPTSVNVSILALAGRTFCLPAWMDFGFHSLLGINRQQSPILQLNLKASISFISFVTLPPVQQLINKVQIIKQVLRTMCLPILFSQNCLHRASSSFITIQPFNIQGTVSEPIISMRFYIISTFFVDKYRIFPIYKLVILCTDIVSIQTLSILIY